MVAAKEFSWEEISSPDFGNPARQAWREAVAETAAKAKAKLPECNGRVDAAVKIVRSSALLVNVWKLSLRWQGEDIVGSCPAATDGLWVHVVGRCPPYPAEESHAIRAWRAMGGGDVFQV
jgi:hypothetical protein